MPRSMFSRWKMPMTSMLVRVSRLPVGSSASRIVGSLTSARAIATRCCWPPESWFGIVMEALAEADRRERLHRALVALGRLHLLRAVVEQRQLDVVERRRPRQQVEALEHEPDLAVPDRSRVRPSTCARRPCRRGCTAARRAIEAAEDVHQRRLAGPRWPGHRDELARLDVQVGAAKRPDRDLADVIGLDEVTNGNDRH